MRIHKTKYAHLTTDELLKEADRQGLNLNEIGRELMYRLEDYVSEEHDMPETLDRR